MTEAPVLEISSSFIRKAIKEGKSPEYFMNFAVWAYVKEMHFYEK